uniref:Uncharacterized protein n=1 Tax=Rhizophora mucronata TaxID=61149 RepID=A0A2P2QPK8_RHIMU
MTIIRRVWLTHLILQRCFVCKSIAICSPWNHLHRRE